MVRCFVNFAVALFIFLSGYLTRIINTDIMIFYKKSLLRVIIPYCICSVLYTINNIRFHGFQSLYNQNIGNWIL